MALRAFHDNPSIGGFGGESTPLLSVQDLLWSRNRKNTTKDHGKASSSSNHPSRPINHGSDGSGDAFCQIVKELVDNAVDACSSNETKKRIRVEIRPYSDPDIIDGNEQQDRRTLNETLVDDSRNEILQISVLDNGVGMDNIQNCVNAFHSSKRLGIDGDDSKEAELQTSGRYGIGLTLCLLHAQRLIPNSYACITSTTRESKHRTRAFFVVDTLGDSIECHREEVIDKRDPVESGTCVSLLVPVRQPLRRSVRIADNENLSNHKRYLTFAFNTLSISVQIPLHDMFGFSLFERVAHKQNLLGRDWQITLHAFDFVQTFILAWKCWHPLFRWYQFSFDHTYLWILTV